MIKSIKAFILGISLLTAAGAHAGIINWSAQLSGSQEVPSVPTKALGTAGGTIDTVTGVVSWVIVAGLPGTNPLMGTPVAAHFHLGVAGANGPVAVNIGNPLIFTGGSAFYAGSGSLVPLAPVSVAGLVQAFRDNAVYINIHTDLFPGGEIRGQVIVPEPGSLALLGLGLLGLGLARRKS